MWKQFGTRMSFRPHWVLSARSAGLLGGLGLLLPRGGHVSGQPGT